MESEFKKIGDFMQSAFDKLVNAGSTINGISGIPSGFKALDKITSGWQDGDLIAIGGRPGMGKTSFILSMIKNIVVDNKIPTMLFSPCMSPQNIVNRILFNMCLIPIDRIQNGMLEPYEWGCIDSNINILNECSLFIDSSPILKIDDLCKKAKEAVIGNGVRIIFIDYLQMLYQEVQYSDNRYLELNYFTRRLKSLARELEIPIIVTSQLNRDIEKRGDCGYIYNRPQLTDFRDSGTICDDCDIAMFIHRPEYYHEYTDDLGNDMHGVAEIIFAKFRNGPLIDCRLKYIQKFGRFEDIAD
mgnify:CR=1 FL=1|jgi:replicative DNA helicase